MSVYLIGTAAILVFAVAFYYSKLVPVCRNAISLAQNAVGVMRSEQLSEEEKETAVQKASLQLLGKFFSILVRSLLVLLASALPIIIADQIGWVGSDDAIAWLSRIDVIVVTCGVMLALYFLFRKLRT